MLALGLTHSPDHQTVADVFEHGHVRKKGVVLEDSVDRAAIGWNAFNGFAENLDMARRRLIESCDQPQTSRFAGPRGSEHREELSGADIEIDAVDCLDGAEMPLDAAKKDRGPVAGSRNGRHEFIGAQRGHHGRGFEP